jgi:hypothetical protein
LGIFFENEKEAHIFGPLFSMDKVCVDFCQKMGWATFCAIFSQTHLVTVETKFPPAKSKPKVQNQKRFIFIFQKCATYGGSVLLQIVLKKMQSSPSDGFSKCFLFKLIN